ncbi:hypothetical protein CWO90_46950, partial [Bradyrhizobium sp. Leo121]
RFAHPSVTGLAQSIPFCVIRSPGSRFCTGSVQDRHLMGLERIGRPIYRSVVTSHLVGNGLT